ncbi:MarC family protein [Prosthecomicrobium sp. N25]|uniref:MarC family protein n=1 Tax=Prosthecomicrobium sp. N25 TaxID=3129254 RepID=UPI0030780B42
MSIATLEQVASDFLFGFGTLFGIINPYGLAFIFLARTINLSDRERAGVALRVALYAFAILIVSLFAGAAILGLFGISLPALRIAGGLVVAASGWTMLHEPGEEQSGTRSSLDAAAVSGMAFFPLTVPLTTGPGTIAAAIALGATGRGSLVEGIRSSIVSLAIAAAAALVVYHAYSQAAVMARLLGVEGTRVVTRLSAFLLLCVGVQIIVTGVTDALQPLGAQVRGP